MGKGRSYRYNSGRVPQQTRRGSPMDPLVKEFRRFFTVKPFEYYDKSGVGHIGKGPILKVRGRWMRKGKDYTDRIREKINAIAATLGRSTQRKA